MTCVERGSSQTTTCLNDKTMKHDALFKTSFNTTCRLSLKTFWLRFTQNFCFLWNSMQANGNETLSFILKKTSLEFFGFPKFVSYHRLFDAATILFLLRIGQNCKRSTVIQICGRPQKTREYGNCRGTYCLAVFQAVWNIAHTHDKRYDMHATNSKLSVKKQEWDMAQVEKTRILKQSYCTFV